MPLSEKNERGMATTSASGGGTRLWLWNQVPEDRPMTDPSILHREGWIVEADRDKEKVIKAAKSKAKVKRQEENDEDDVKYYCRCRQVCLCLHGDECCPHTSPA